MNKHKLKQLMACALICTTLGTGIVSMKSTTVDAMSFNKLYEATYNSVAKLKDLGNQYYITPRLANNGSKMEDNHLESLINSVDEIQSTINQLRSYQYQFPNSYWKARNTFSEIGDSYQQPIYEWIVDCAIKMKHCATKTFLDDIPSNDQPYIVMYIQKYITGATILNKGVDLAYRGAYQAALDEDQKQLDSLLDNNLKKSQKIGKIFGKTYKDQLKDKEEFYKDLTNKEKNELKQLDNSLTTNPKQALIDILEECKDMKNNPNSYSPKYKIAFTNNIINFMLIDMFNNSNDNSKKLSNSATYRFNKAFLDNSETLLKNLTDYTDHAIITTRTIELKSANAQLKNKIGVDSITSFEDAFKEIKPSKTFNEKELEKQESEVINYEDDLRKKQEAAREKAYEDLINKDSKERTLKEQQEEEIKHEEKIIKDAQAKREKAYEDLINKK